METTKETYDDYYDVKPGERMAAIYNALEITEGGNRKIWFDDETDVIFIGAKGEPIRIKISPSGNFVDVVYGFRVMSVRVFGVSIKKSAEKISKVVVVLERL